MPLPNCTETFCRHQTLQNECLANEGEEKGCPASRPTRRSSAAKLNKISMLVSEAEYFASKKSKMVVNDIEYVPLIALKTILERLNHALAL